MELLSDWREAFFFWEASVLKPIRQPKSMAGVPFDSVRRFRATLLLRTTLMRLYCNSVSLFVFVFLCFIKPYWGIVMYGPGTSS